MGEPEVLIERRGRAGWITLNRPQALNALTLAMVRAIALALEAWERDAAISRVIIAGAGGRAFCAGGDLRRLYEQGRAGDHDSQLTLWREEYQLNHRIKRYAKPYIALIDGLVMGGGVGISLHGSHVIAGERYRFAMPEVGIGFFPDVGAASRLAHLPHRIGLCLALTGARADAGDALALGLAQTFAPSAAFPDLQAALEGSAPLTEVLSRFAAPPPPSRLIGEAPLIEAAFASGDPATILTALEAARAGEISTAMSGKSPTSQAIAARQIALYRDMPFEDALRTDFRIVSRVCRGEDFYEGVRALIIDKDNRPVWRPTRLAEVSDETLDAYFAPLGAGELTFGKTA